MNITIFPEPPDITYEFMDRQSKVGIHSGDIYQNDMPVGYYVAAAYVETKTDLDLLVTIGQEDSTGKFHALTTIGARCSVGTPADFYAIEPHESPWEESFLYPNFVSPADYENTPLAQKAFRFIEHIVAADSGLREYLQNGLPQYALESDIVKAGTYGLDKNSPWPYNYVISALQFLSLPAEQFEKYLPKRFSETLFHAKEGDFYSTSPLATLLSISTEAIEAGQRWNDWIYANNLKDPDIERSFRNLMHQLYKVLDIDERNERMYRDMLLHETQHHWVTDMKDCRKLAINILKKIGWYRENITPVFSSVELLNEYSYGMYGNNREFFAVTEDALLEEESKE